MTEQEKVSNDFELMDREDEAQILEELRGVVSDKFIYKNSRGQFELSYAGTKWAIRKMADQGEAIRIKGHPKVDRCVIDPEYITVTVLSERVKVDRDAKCEIVLDNTVGSSRGWIKQKLLDGRIVPDEFFYNKTISKATRNAQQAMLPQDFKKEMIDLLVKKQAGQLPPSAAKAPKKAAAPPAGAAAPAPGAPAAAQKPAGPAAAPAKAAAPAQPPPTKPAPQKPATTAAPAAQAAKPAAPAAQKPAVPNTTKPAPGQSPREAGLDVMCQRFLIVLRQASGAGQDLPKALAFLAALTGKDAVNKLSKEEIAELGPVLHGLTKGASRHENGVIYDAVTGEQLYPRTEAQQEPVSEPQAEPVSTQQSDPSDGPEPTEPMF
jgi:hypothetical protein